MQIFTGATTLGAPPKPVEIKIPLWWADGTNISFNATSSGTQFLNDGGANTSNNSSSQLHTLSSKWFANTKFAIEVTFSTTNASYAANVALWDFSLGTPAVVSGSQITTTSTTDTVIRSSQFTLTSGHTVGFTAWIANAGSATYITDASLIVFP